MTATRRVQLIIGAALTAGAALLAACGGGDDAVVVPDGFAVEEHAVGLRSPAALAFDAEGRLFVAEAGAGRVSILTDDDGDGRAENSLTFAEGLMQPLGLAFGPEGRLYVSIRGQVGILVDRDGDDVSDYMVGIILDLPHGLHQNNGIAFGPDGMLYVTNGSTCNVCDEENWRSAAILRSDANGNGLEVFASGLRNPYDLAFGPDGRLWATDNGPDPPKVAAAPDELNLILEGGHYGWPKCVGSMELAPRACAAPRPPAVEFDAHSSSDGIAYYAGDDFPSEYRGSLFVAQWGNNEGRPDSGRKVMRVPVEGSDVPQAEVFASGFSRPLALSVGPEGALYVADYGRGTIYRISWVGEAEVTVD